VVGWRADEEAGKATQVMIPAFAVPLSLILHRMSIWQLRRAALAPSGRTAAVA
jgi:hypothetical protein